MVGIFLIACIGLGIAFRHFYWAPRAQMRNLSWLETASPEDQRNVAHHVLRFPGGHHDAFILLERCGTRESIACLIDALWWQSEEDESMTCERACALKALRRITGVDPGNRYDDWKRWWEAHR